MPTTKANPSDPWVRREAQKEARGNATYVSFEFSCAYRWSSLQEVDWIRLTELGNLLKGIEPNVLFQQLCNGTASCHFTSL